MTMMIASQISSSLLRSAAPAIQPALLEAVRENGRSALSADRLRSLGSLHFLVHPLFVSHPEQTAGEDARNGYPQARKLTGLYLDRARSLHRDAALFLFSHLKDDGLPEDPVYLGHYRNLVRGLQTTLGDRFFFKTDEGIFEDPNVADSLCDDLEDRGFRMGRNLRTYAYGETTEICVADAAQNLKESFHLKRRTTILTRYTDWARRYHRNCPQIQETLRRRGLKLA
jgi:hypothetical protein